MTSLTEQPPYNMFAHHESDEFGQVFTSGPMNMNIPAEAFPNFQQHGGQDVFSASLGFEATLFNETTSPSYMLQSCGSPSMYDESDMRLSSSSLSTASAPSATSSAIGSPQSNHGQMGAGPEWASAAHGLGVQPGIVGNDYMMGSDFAAVGMEEYTGFEFGAPVKGFVGELDASTTSIDTTAGASDASPRGSAAQQRPPHHGITHCNTSPCSPKRISTMSCNSFTASYEHCTSGHDPCHNSPSLSQPLSSPSASSSCTSTGSAQPLTPSFIGPERPTSSSAISSTETIAWSSQPTRRLSPIVSPSKRDVAFFSQSSGHFVAPLQSPPPPWSSSTVSPLAATPTCPTMIADFGFATDPSLIHAEALGAPMGIPSYDTHFQQNHYPTSPSAASSSPQPNIMRTNSSSPYLHNGPFTQGFPSSPFGAPVDRAPSIGNFVPPTPGESHSGDEKEKQRCTWPDCGRVFKDLKAHMLTHQNERPEKCPIQTCDYHTKGFARKYDKNRHTLTHYKGTMVCGFCPGSGSAAEKSFNRADVFKRHLTSVHGVEQAPPNTRKKSGTGVKKVPTFASDATGKCSTCSQTFANVQDFYEHLDECVLRIVQQLDPAEAINAKHMAEVENDKEVHETLEKNNLPIATETTSTEEDDEEADTDEDDGDSSKSSHSPTTKKKGNPANGVQKSRGLTHSRGGVALPVKRSRKNRREYPSSWGFDKGQMTMKKRVLAVFDGPRRLAKDDMMLCTDHEVRIKLSDGKSYITDLDVQTLKRAEGFHGATASERGPWVSDDPTAEQLKEMQEVQMMLDTKTAAVA